MKKLIFLVSFLLLLLPFISADVIVPFSLQTIFFFPFILVVEVIVFWLLSNKVFKINVNFWKSLLIILAANVVTSFIGTFILYDYLNFVILLIAFILSVFVEFGVYLLFFIKKKIKKISLLWISLVANFLTYLGLAIFYL